MTAKIRRPVAAVSSAMLLVLAVASLGRAADVVPQPVARFLAADGTPLSEQWQAAPGAPTFVLIHGFRSRGTDNAFLRQAAAIGHRFPRAHVLTVDWHLPSPSARNGHTEQGGGWASVLFDGIRRLAGDYDTAVGATWDVARDIADWLQSRRVDPARTVLCGRSLGAHIAGFVGRDLAGRMGRPVWAILAADPAGPSFVGRGPDARLDKTDALQVLVIHTTDWLGYAGPLGTVDVYVAWQERHMPDPTARHSYARELITESFLRGDLVCSAGHPFGANALVPLEASGQDGPSRRTYLVVSAPPLAAVDTNLRNSTISSFNVVVK